MLTSTSIGPSSCSARVDRLVDRAGVGHVQANGERRLVRRAVGDVAGDHTVPARRQRAHDRAADATRPAGDQGHAATCPEFSIATKYCVGLITMRLVANFGPAGLPSALVLTIDNLGEARALERGTQPPEEPVGNDPSVTVALPWLLDELDAHSLSATFFVEGINTELYPDALRELTARGHQLGLHGWRHEEWASLSATDERDTLARGVEAFAGLGIEARGFRPPAAS